MKPILQALAVALLMVLSISARADAPRTISVDPRAIEVVDGDTIRFGRGHRLAPDAAAIGHGRLRLLDIDTPELFSPRCQAEHDQAAAAAARLRDLVRRATVARIVLSDDRDPYRRPLVRLELGSADAGNVLMRERLALPWRPGREDWIRRGHHWCPAWVPPSEQRP